MAMQVADTWYERRSIGDGITFLTEPHVHDVIRCNIWHVHGRDRDLLVDTGLGLVSLRNAARDLFGGKLITVLTHAHFDHMGGSHEFDPCFIHAAERQSLESAEDSIALTLSGFDADVLRSIREAGYELDEESLLSAIPYAGFQHSTAVLRPGRATRLLEEGDVVDLGDRVFEVLHLPGHSPGSVGLYERRSQTLFSGDAIYDGPLLVDLPGSDRSKYAETLERLLRLPVAVAHGGHGPSMSGDRLRGIASAYLDRWANPALSTRATE
jgi:glyoxylase-like metal-dependent hydrolase (beta-lactamase superfamily II)